MKGTGGKAAARNSNHLEIIFDSVIDIIFLIAIEEGERYRFTRVNKAFCNATGLSPEKVVGLYVNDIIPEASREIVLGNYRKAIQERQTVQWEEISVYPAGEKAGIVSVTPVFDENNECSMLVGTVHDITERKKAEEEKEKIREQFMIEKELSEIIINSLPGIFYMFTDKGKYLRWNKNHETVPGYTTEEMENMFPLNFFDGPDKTLIEERISKVFTEGIADAEADFMTKDGKKIPYYFTGKLVMYQNVPCLLGVGLDMTDKKRLEQQIVNQKVEEQKKMTRAVLNAQESERNIIGQELHDNVNQILIGSKIHLGLISDVNGKNKELIKNSMELIDKAIREIQSLTRQQVTPHKEIDLHDLVQSLVNHLNNTARIKTSYRYMASRTGFSDDLKLNVYRIIQEAANNIIKHASAKNVAMSIIEADGNLDITIADDGKGFDTNQAKAKGIGLANILNRVNSYNGTVCIRSAPGSGCTIELSIPASSISILV